MDNSSKELQTEIETILGLNEEVKTKIFLLEKLKFQFVFQHEQDLIDEAIEKVKLDKLEDNYYNYQEILSNFQNYPDELVIDSINGILKNETSEIDKIKQIFHSAHKHSLKFHALDKLIRLEEHFDFFYNQKIFNTKDILPFKKSLAYVKVSQLLQSNNLSEEHIQDLLKIIFNEKILIVDYFLDEKYQQKIIETAMIFLDKIK
ncbi:hypothetical protein [Mycoplasmopsis agassizii]|uniref:Uncharacterized protein n=1 Tax=Mycoplasmopsis agassizii TaxID=33922 RepID=A0ABX4H4B8_9BACT|nr:hypothetical protein [Mycoplasmopsis agassizii]PAF54736.1 hypothetical protein CJF60_03285 [Mycoplasmopsis agassizii]SMC15898.1 hypothetical protein SAMN02745179_00145 [Mycoplasmopsis agassizii]